MVDFNINEGFRRIMMAAAIFCLVASLAGGFLIYSALRENEVENTEDTVDRELVTIWVSDREIFSFDEPIGCTGPNGSTYKYFSYNAHGLVDMPDDGGVTCRGLAPTVVHYGQVAIYTMEGNRVIYTDTAVHCYHPEKNNDVLVSLEPSLGTTQYSLPGGEDTVHCEPDPSPVT